MSTAVMPEPSITAPSAAASQTPAPATAPVPNRKPRVVFLDVIRGLAALSVLIQHTTEEVTKVSDSNNPFLFWTFRWFNFGRVGVAAFFLVSGFVIPYSLERANSLKHFWVSRFFRLYPLYWFSLCLVVVYHFAGNDEMMKAYAAHWVPVLLKNITMFQEFIHTPDAIGLYWTLTLEMVFYILFSALFLVGINKKTLTWAWLGLGVMLAGGIVQAKTGHKVPTARVGLLSLAFVGTAVFRYYSGLISQRQLTLLSIGTVIAFSITFSLGFPTPGNATDIMEPWTNVAMISSHAAAALLFAAIFMFRSREFPFPLRWLGTISYSVYLLHYPVWLALINIPHKGPINGPLWQLLVLSVTCAAASLTYLFVEKPAIEIGKRLLGKPKPATELGHPHVERTASGRVSVITDG